SFSGAKEEATTDQCKETHRSLAPVRVQVAAHRAKSLPGLSRLCLVLPNWIDSKNDLDLSLPSQAVCTHYPVQLKTNNDSTLNALFLAAILVGGVAAVTSDQCLDVKNNYIPTSNALSLPSTSYFSPNNTCFPNSFYSDPCPFGAYSARKDNAK
ncbi:MAG: hypothetical protein AAFP00_11830, partial [Bacteroidota bacterium]